MSVKISRADEVARGQVTVRYRYGGRPLWRNRRSAFPGNRLHGS